MNHPTTTHPAHDDRAFKARWIIPMGRPPIENAVIRIRFGHINWLGRASDHDAPPAEDLGDVILLPGLINAHAHLELTAYHGKIARAPLWDWLDHLLSLRRQPGSLETERAAVIDGARRSLRAGVTLIADISRTGLNIEPLSTLPIRKVCFIELISAAQLPPNDIPSLEATLAAYSRFESSDRLVLGVSPHAPYSVTPTDLTETISLAARRKLPQTMHMLETPDEAAWLAGRPNRLDQFLRDRSHPNAAPAARASPWNLLAASHPPALLAHLNIVDDTNLSQLIHSRCSVVWCPRAHRYFNHPPHRWREMLAAGVNLCLGTDGLPCNDSLSILDELRFLRRQAPDFPPADLLALATTRPADALGFKNRLGRLSLGAYPDFIAIPLDPRAPSDPIANIIDGTSQVSRVWIDAVPICNDSPSIPFDTGPRNTSTDPGTLPRARP